MGGIVALTLWRDHPEVVRSLALADTWANHPTAAAGQAERLAAIDAASMPELARARMPAIYGPAASLELIDKGVNAFAALDKAPYRAASADLWTQDLRKVARTVAVPTLVLVGEHDTLTPLALSEELASLIPDARLAVISRAGHLSNEENPPAFNSALDAHLALGG
jgi:3-oxoadipate enol-lactonase